MPGMRLSFDGMSKKGMMILVDQAVASATNFLTGVIIGRSCTREEFGLYMLGFTVVLLVINLQSALITAPFTVFSPRLEGNAYARYFGSTLLHHLGLSVLVIFGLTAGALLSRESGANGLASVLWILVGVSAFIMLREYARQICFASLTLKTALVLDSSVSLFQLGGLLTLAYLGVLSASFAYLIIGIGCGISGVTWVFIRRSNYALRPREAILDLGRNWALAKWLVAGALAFAVSQQSYPWLLAAYHGNAATGVLSACMGVLFVANPFLIGMGNFLGPKVAHAFADGGTRHLESVVTKGTLFFALTMGIFCLTMILFGGSFVVLVYGSQYAGNGPVVGVLALSQFASAVTFPANYGLNALERPDIGFGSYLLALGVTFTLGLFLVKSLGPMGVACGLLAGNVTASVYRYFGFKTQLRRLRSQ